MAFDQTVAPGTTVEMLDEVLTKRFLSLSDDGEGEHREGTATSLDPVLLSKLRIVG